MIYGTKPGSMVDADTSMVKDIVKTLYKKIDRRNLSVQIPKSLG